MLWVAYFLISLFSYSWRNLIDAMTHLFSVYIVCLENNQGQEDTSQPAH